MTDRERLIEILSKPIYVHEGVDCTVAVADYLIDNGVIVPPCKVGDKIYGLFESNRLYGKTRVVEYVVDELLLSTKRGVRPWIICCYGGRRFDNCEFGKTVFLTKEEAEKALKERSDTK